MIVKKIFAFGRFFLLKNNFCSTKNIFIDFLQYNNYNRKNLKILRKVAVDMERGRPKLEISRTRAVTIRVTEFEFQKIARVAKQKNLTKTDAILKGIDLLERDKPKILRSQLNQQKNIHPKIKKNLPGTVEED